MDYRGQIIDFNFISLAIGSTIRLTIDVPALNHPVMLEYNDSSERLSQRFQFTVEPSEPLYDLTGLRNRHCIIRETEDGFDFLRFSD